MLRAGSSRAATALLTVAAGAATTLLTSWAVGRLVQREPVVRPSRKVYDYTYQHRSAAVACRLDPITTIGGYSVIGSCTALVGAMIAYDRRSWRPLQLLAAGALAEVYFQKALKRLVKGSKPAPEFSIGPPGDFPSGGAARTLITFGMIAHLLAQRWDSPAERAVIWSAAGGLVLAQGGSRLYLGRHWPEDVLGGWLFGGLILGTLIRLDAVLAAGARSAGARSAGA
ncbi:MAG: phosphatase PAP2 family protein [Streptosporangiaceae bacterium]